MKKRQTAIGFCILGAVLPVLGCDGVSPTAPNRAVTALPAVTATPTVPLAAVRVSLVPASSPQGLRHAFTIHVEVRETRGVGISAIYRGVFNGTNHNFPERETDFGRVSSVPPFGTGTIDILVEHNDGIECGTGLLVRVEIDAADGREQVVDNTFDCSTGFWPL